MHPREIDPREINWESESREIDRRKKVSGIKIRKPKIGTPARGTVDRHRSPAAGLALLALALGLGACDGPPREKTAVEKICASQSNVACMQAKAAEQRRIKAAKELEAAGMLDNR